jgi:hypothetical protein
VTSSLTLVRAVIFLSALLLFALQPLVGRALLPALGGSPAAWTMCLLFFQVVLLLGYLYAHVLVTRVPASWQWPVHVAMLIAGSAALPLALDAADPVGDERLWTLVFLARHIGLPAIVLSATSRFWPIHLSNP